MNTTGAKKVKNENGQYITGEYNYRGFRLSNDNGTWKVYKLTEDGEPYGDVVLTASHKVCAIIEVDKLLTVKRYYIAYGSNINTTQMAHRCPTAVVEGTSTVPGYELVFKGSRSYAVATIEKKEGASVPVLVWSIKPSDERALDRYEGFPHLYIKQDFQIELNGETITAMAYVMTEGRPLGQPGAAYLTTILEGYKEFDFEKKPLFNAAVALRASRQATSRFDPCPRCGKDSMRKEKLTHNAWSRRADIYVCENCGMVEALRDATHTPDDINEWRMFC